jgi:glycosyltransferase involved in cell wall biosynthesis
VNVSILSETAAWGGAEAHTVALAQTLAGRGHEVLVVALGHDCFDAAARRSGAGFRVRRVHLHKPVKKWSLAECRALVRELPDGVGVLARWGLDVGSLRLDLAARWRFRRYVAIEHSAAEMLPRETRRHLGGLLPGAGLWWWQGLALWHLRSVVSNLVVCVSAGARRRLVRDFRVPARKVVTVHNGIDGDRFRPDAQRRAAARRSWGVPENAVVIGAVGRLSPEKRLDVTVGAVKRLAARLPELDLRLVLVGDGTERMPLQEAARAAGLGERAVFAGFTDRPWEAYCGLDVFALPSREEALPLALLEAMACGCCPVAAGVGGVPEVLADPRTGWLVPPYDEEAFTAALHEAVLAGAARRAEVGRRARDHVMIQFEARRQYAALADWIVGQDSNPANRVRCADGRCDPAEHSRPHSGPYGTRCRVRCADASHTRPHSGPYG